MRAFRPWARAILIWTSICAVGLVGHITFSVATTDQARAITREEFVEQEKVYCKALLDRSMLTAELLIGRPTERTMDDLAEARRITGDLSDDPFTVWQQECTDYDNTAEYRAAYPKTFAGALRLGVEKALIWGAAWFSLTAVLGVVGLSAASLSEKGPTHS